MTVKQERHSVRSCPIQIFNKSTRLLSLTWRARWAVGRLSRWVIDHLRAVWRIFHHKIWVNEAIDRPVCRRRRRHQRGHRWCAQVPVTAKVVKIICLKVKINAVDALDLAERNMQEKKKMVVRFGRMKTLICCCDEWTLIYYTSSYFCFDNLSFVNKVFFNGFFCW